MQAFKASREQPAEKTQTHPDLQGDPQPENSLVGAFFADQEFVAATKAGMKAVDEGDVGILLEDLRRQVSESPAS